MNLMPRAGALLALLAVSLLTLPASAWQGEPMRNDDVLKLTKAGMTETFILDLIESKPAGYNVEPGTLVELKKAGVSERTIAAMARKSPPKESWNSETVINLTKAGFSEQFILDGVKAYPGRFATDTGRIVQLKEAGISETVIAAMVGRTPAGNKIPAGVEIAVRTIDAIDSSKAGRGDTFRASLEEPIMMGGEEVAPKGADATLAIVEERDSGKITGKAMLSLQLVSVTARGREVKLNTETVDTESESRGKKTATRALILGGVGAAIGGIAGGGSGAAIGAAAGGGAGVASGIITGGEKVQIPSETVLRFRTLAPLGV